jgi:hypothetical protein
MAPTLHRLKQLIPRLEVVGVFRDSSVLYSALRDPILGGVLRDTVDRRLILRSDSGSYNFCSIFGAICAAVVRKAPVVLHGGLGDAGFFGWLATLARLRKGLVCKVPNSMVVTLGRHDVRRLTISPDTIALYFSKSEAERMRIAGDSHTRAIGFPRLYRSWVDHVGSLGPALLSESIPQAQRGDFALILLSSTLMGVFDKGELDVWFNEVVQTLRRHYSCLRLLIKPHPMQSLEQLEQFAAQLDPSREFITHVHVGALAKVSRFAVSLSSSSILDVLAMGTPLVLHQRFTRHWTIRHPEGSSYLGLGVPHSVDEESLVAALASANKPDAISDNLIDAVDHHEDLSVFTDFLLQGKKP